MFPFRVERGAGKHFRERLASLLSTSDIRIMQVLEILQYGVIYMALAFALGAGLELVFPRFDEKKEWKPVALEVVLQVLSFVVLVFYVRKIAKLVPFMFQLQWDLDGNGKIAKFRPYQTTEYSGEIAIGLVLIASQANLLKKIDLLARELYSWYYKQERRVRAVF